jgi:hypothetical protein
LCPRTVCSGSFATESSRTPGSSLPQRDDLYVADILYLADIVEAVRKIARRLDGV